MRFIGSSNDLYLKPIGEVSIGDLLVRRWKKYCRRAKFDDEDIMYIAVGKDSEFIRAHSIQPDEIYLEE